MDLSWKRKIISALCLISLIGSISFAPMAVQAQGIPVIDVTNITTQNATKALEKIWKSLGDAALGAVRSGLNAILGQLAYEAATKISTGDAGQDAMFFTDDPKTGLKNVGDLAVGGVIEGFATGLGFDAAGICDPGGDFALNITLGLDITPQKPYKPACTLSELAGNWEEAYSDPDFGKLVNMQFDPTANALGASMEIENLTIVASAEEVEARKIEEQKGFKPVTSTVSGYIETPGSQVQAQFEGSQLAQTKAYDMIGNPVADAINIFASTLFTNYMKKIMDGIANRKIGTDLTSIISGEGAGASQGIAAARQRFADLKIPSFGQPGTFDILAELQACPDEIASRTVNNCNIGQIMSLAISEGWTVRELVDYYDTNGNAFRFADRSLTGDDIVGDGGISYRGILVLKKYRVIPVGWDLAAQYIQSEDDFSIGLSELVDAYDKCGADDFSDFCHLIDPDWVLKAPQNFCQREAPGPDFADISEFDDDSNNATQDEVVFSRLNYCADNRGCIQEEQEGVCTAYGYCTDEERIYRFAGDVCEEEYGSCITYTDSDDNEVSYLKNSLNFNDCATDPGCQWYCLSTNDSGTYDCASSTETFISCDQTYATASADYDYEENVACSCNIEDTCTIQPGSDLGADADADGVYDYWQCKVYPDASNPSSYQVCQLDSACGAGSPAYDATAGACTCVLDYSCDVSADASTCDVADTADNDADGDGSADAITITCALDDENIDASADKCAEAYSTYSTAPVCSPTLSSSMYCGDTCIVADGESTCTNSLDNVCTDGDSLDGDVRDDYCLLQDTCDVNTGAFTCTSDNGNTCSIGVEVEDPAEENATLYFDDNAEACDSSDAGCTQYIRTVSDTNLLRNAFFTYYDEDQNDLDDPDGAGLTSTDRDFIGFCTHDGGGCYADESCYEDVNGDGSVDLTDPTEQVGQCEGWIQDDLEVFLLSSDYTAGISPDYGDSYIRLAADADPLTTGTLSMTIDTGQSLSDRTFTFAYRAISLEEDGDSTTADCPFNFSIGDEAATEIETVTSIAVDEATTLNSYSTSWNDFYYTYTFPDEDDLTNYSGSGDAGTTLTVSIQNDDVCHINIDAIQLTESASFEDYAEYNSSNQVYLNDNTVSCEPEDVGCELYVEDGKDDEEGVPGIITNPESSSCVNPDGSYNFEDSACNQCNGNPEEDQVDDYYVGCGFYQEESIDHTVPITEEFSWLSTEERAGVMERYGGYCEFDQAQYCFNSGDCGDQNADGTPDACQLQVSIVPASAEQCSAAYVGCEEYTNLEASAEGGETLQYFSEIKQCVKQNDDDTDVFYTFEGSDDGGIQIEDHTLKVVHGAGDNDGAPCTNLDLQSESYNADCVDFVSETPNDCGPDSYCTNASETTETGCSGAGGTWIEGDDAYGSGSSNYDPDCRQYINDEGDIFYRYESEVIAVSDQCTTLRSSLDTRVYFGITGESESCPAPFVGCREYKGTDSGAYEEVINESLSSNSTEDWTNASSTSNESPLQGGYSLELNSTEGGAATASTDFAGYYEYSDINTGLTETSSAGEVSGKLTPGSSYLLTFWAKVDSSDSQALFWIDPLVSGVNTPYYFTTAGWTDTRTAAAVDLDPNQEGGWQFYQVGPVILDTNVEVDDERVGFHMQFMDTSGTSAGYITTIIVTESSDQYLVKGTADTCLNFEGCREYKDRDSNIHYLKSYKRLCDDDVVGCEAMIATQNSSHPFTEAYNLDNEYDEDNVIVQHDQAVTLVYDEDNECSESVLGCSEIGLPSVDERTGYVDEFSAAYIRDLPDSYNSILCEQPQLSCKMYESEYDGTQYFKNPGEKLCTLEEYTNDAGDVLNGWFKLDSTAASPDCPKQFDYADPSSPLGGVCNSNSNNSDSGDNKIGKLCNSDGDCFPDGWAEGDPTPRCISDPDDDIDVLDGNVHQYLTYADDGETLETEDYGWVGQCPASQSGCSEYVDPFSPNIDEIAHNWSFENDILWENGSPYATDDEPTGFPDKWEVPLNSGAQSEYKPDDGSYEDYYTEFDLDNDGTSDFDNGCHSGLASASFYTGPSTETSWGTLYGNANDRVVLTNSENYTSSDITPAEGDDAAWIDDCAIQNTHKLTIERDKLYTVRAMVKLQYTESAYNASNFSIGIRYYDEDFSAVEVDDEYMYVTADHETIDWNTQNEKDDSDGMSVWYQYQGNIGLGSTVEFPDPAEYGNCSYPSRKSESACDTMGGTWSEVKYAYMFVANHDSTNPIWVDAASFKENDKYYYLDYTVDGTSEYEQDTGGGTCIDQDTEEGAITSDGGCVAFRDITYDTQNYSQAGLDCTNCLLTPNADSCRYVVDACDTNTVLKVKRDRVCSEWLACSDAQLVTDEDGNESSQCFALDRCFGLDEDGQCKDWVRPTPELSEISSLTDYHYTTAPGDAESILEARNFTGYVKVGMTWLGTQVCNGSSPYAGETCTSDSDCYGERYECDTSTSPYTCVNNGEECTTEELAEVYDGALDYLLCDPIEDDAYCTTPIEVEGYIPYGWMYEVGEDGAESGDDLIEHSTFENLYCVGEDADLEQQCISNATTADVTSASYDAGHCFRSEFEQRLTNVDAAGALIEYDDPISFVEGIDEPSAAEDGTDDPTYYCPNDPAFLYWPFGGWDSDIADAEFTKYGWQPMNDSTNVEVSQFSTNTRTRFATFGGSSSIGFTCIEDDCPRINVNNVLQFSGSFSGDENDAGVEYDLYDNIEGDAMYSLSFDARFAGSYNKVGEADDPSSISICLNHNNLVLEGGCLAGTCSNDAGSCSDSTDCEIPLERKDCFVEGVSGADIVFVVDTSSSMDNPINSIRTAAPTLALKLAELEIDAKFAVVDMDQSVQDLSLENHLTADINEISTIFSDSCVGSDYRVWPAGFSRTDDPCLHASAASVDGFAGVQRVIEDNLNYYNSTYVTDGDASIGFRSNALPIIVLITDTDDEITSNSYSESTVLNTLYQSNAVIIAISDSGDVGTWTTIADASGGGTSSDISATDWTAAGSVLDTVVEIIDREVDRFQFSEFLESYSFGPLETTQGSTADGSIGVASGQTHTTDLEFQVSDATPVQLDNVSLKPVLQTRLDESIGRTCRAYPRNDSEQCEYTEPSGAVYKGWKGYCVEEDPSNQRRCITWWPLDYLTGEESIVSRTSAGYDGPSDVYHCLVAKGLEEPGFCDEATWNSSDPIGTRGAGVICTSDHECGSANCIDNRQYDLKVCSNDDCTSTSNSEHDDTSKQHAEMNIERDTADGYTIRMRWQTHDPYDAAGSTSYITNAPYGAQKYGSSLITRLPANEQLRNVHISEIDSIIFNTGSAGRGNNNEKNEWEFWGQQGFDPGDQGKSFASGDVNEEYLKSDESSADNTRCDSGGNTGGIPCQNYGNYVLTDFDAGSIYQDSDGSYKPWENCYAHAQEATIGEDTYGFGCRLWGLYDSNFTKAWYEENVADGTAENMDIVYTWAWSNFDWGLSNEDDGSDAETMDGYEGTDCNIPSHDDNWKSRFNSLADDHFSDMFSSACVGRAIKNVMGFSRMGEYADEDIPSFGDNRNPWKEIGSGEDIADCIQDDVVDENTKTCRQTSVYYDQNNPSGDSMWESWSDVTVDREGPTQDSHGGSNIFTLWIDVNAAGYIQAVYYLIYIGAIGTNDSVVGFELTHSNHMHLDFQVRETCALIASSVDSNGENSAWSYRSTDDASFQLASDTDDAYGRETPTDPFGSISPVDTSFLYIDTIDTDSTTQSVYNWSTYNSQPIIAFAGDTIVNAGRPLSCIGKCENTWCTSDLGENSYYAQGESNIDGCGDYGKTMGVGVGDGAGNKEGVSTAHTTLTDQINDAAEAGRDRLKHVFADIKGSFYKFEPSSLTSVYTQEEADSVDYWKNGSGENIFDAMEICTEADGSRPIAPNEDSEYCGVLPTIDNFVIDGNDSFADGYYDIIDGKTVTLQFDADVNAEQEWLDTIYIDWGDGRPVNVPWEAQATTHVFTHAYRCGPEYQDDAVEYNNNGEECVFEPRVTITDNWRFCSGDEHDDLNGDGTTDDSDASSGQQNRVGEGHENVKESCNSYDVPDFLVRVSLGDS